MRKARIKVWLAVDEDGSEVIFSSKPSRGKLTDLPGIWISQGDDVVLPKGTIKKLIGKELTWNDEPVEI